VQLSRLLVHVHFYVYEFTNAGSDSDARKFNNRKKNFFLTLRIYFYSETILTLLIFNKIPHVEK